MNELILILVPIVIIILNVIPQNKTFKFISKFYYYSKFIVLLIPFILIYLKPEIKDKLLKVFKDIDNQPVHMNMNDMMSSYFDTKKNNYQRNYSYPQNNQMNYNQGNYSYPQNNFQMNNRMNMINPKNFRHPQAKPVRHKRNVSESKKKYIASQQKWRCTHCSSLLDNTYEVDHIVALYKGGTNELNNLEALCRNCHGKKTFKEKMGL